MVVLRRVVHQKNTRLADERERNGHDSHQSNAEVATRPIPGSSEYATLVMWAIAACCIYGLWAHDFSSA